ncbi:membrane fusion protein, multidrug efflux system [Afifella marina DSM 2698]|uniref:Membrane fusion protein, multidrug efflux system n=2 Tax=Afifella marina TaxID=1080 RepID=A0A1G5NH47_AFIMA|nr:membrane fusion protein, multidrug efflux system [Afifella marina DSM 2698]
MHPEVPFFFGVLMSEQASNADDGERSEADPEDSEEKERSETSHSSDEDDGGSPLKKPWARVFLVVAGIALLVGGGWWLWHYWTVGRFIESTNDAYLQADQVTISPKVGGYVEDVMVKANAGVEAGDVLVKINDEDYRAGVARAAAGLQAARADLAKAKAEAGRSRVAVQQAEAQLAQAEVNEAFAQSQVERYAPLVKTGAQPEERLSQLINQRDQAEAQVKVASASLASAHEATNTADAQILQARAAVHQAQAQLTDANNQLANTLIKSPISGRVGDKTVNVGQLVQPGTRLMTIVPVDQLYLEANFKETQIELMRVGQPATVKVDALTAEKLHGHVESFSPATGAQFALIPPENATGNFTKIVQRVPVRIAVDPGPAASKVLVPGLSVTVEVDTRGARDEYEELQEEGRRSEEAAQ